MKKQIIVFALLLPLLIGSAIAGGKPRKNSRTEMGINGNARYVLEYTYNLHGGKNGGRQLVCVDSITFDKRGNFQDHIRRTNGEYTYFSYYFDVNGYPFGWNAQCICKKKCRKKRLRVTKTTSWWKNKVSTPTAHSPRNVCTNTTIKAIIPNWIFTTPKANSHNVTFTAMTTAATALNGASTMPMNFSWLSPPIITTTTTT